MSARTKSFSDTATVLTCPGIMGAKALSGFIAALKREAPWHAPLFKALLAGEIGICIPLPHQSLPLRVLYQLKLPTIVLICDDGPVEAGPDGWACTQSSFRWAWSAMLHGTGGDPNHYKIALEAALKRKRFVIADTGSPRLPEWQTAARRDMGSRPILSVEPPPGLVHPASPARRPGVQT